MPQLEVFFDYACPYCEKAHQHLKKIVPVFPQLEIAWCPCESHPRPEQYGIHSDLCIRGMFFAQDHGLDLWQWHDCMFDALFTDRINVEDIDTLANYAKNLIDPEALAAAFRSGEYKNALAQSNHRAYEESGVWVVPAYRMGGAALDAQENIGVTYAQLENFIKKSI